ncbi:MFS transporter [Microbaculum marinisediminis]|uniref:MFS transporter n=1 Tax=Microbaculum marinisediminis TaxID=2931392 RepID=A0AAW5QYV0_9HYPH|nr:MFS transporter [Microbaculum sp. A6E488]MCT8973241.1 MFS transporter [Microbaculum sp. A6E488]
MTPLRPLAPLLLTAGILLAGNGVQGTMIALRGSIAGFDPWLIGLMGTSYFGGFIVACVYAPRLVEAVGHIRTFAALAAIASAGTLALVLIVDAWAWIVLRFAMGFCFSGLFTVMESWLNASAEKTDRARVLSIYRLIDLGAVTGAQYLIPAFGAGGFELFAIVAMFFALSLVPVAVADRTLPAPPEAFRFDLRTVWRISPLASIGCVTIGMTNSSFRLIGPLYAQDMGLDVAQIATFMGAGIVGGAALQMPLGIFSDKLDRRWTLLAATTGAVLAGIYLTTAQVGAAWQLYLGIFLFGAFALPLYSLSAAHANDLAAPGQYVLLAAGLTFFFAIGAMAGPLFSSWVMEQYGAASLFVFTSIVHGSFVVVALWRIAAGQRIPRTARTRFVALLRTSPAIFRLAERTEKRHTRTPRS